MSSPVASVKRELLVRYLDSWTPTALHGGRRATFAQAGDGDTAEAAVRVFAEFADRLRGRQLTMLVVAEAAEELSWRLAAVQTELSTPADLSVHVMAGGVDRVPVALKAAGAGRAPLLVYLDASGEAPPDPATLAAVAGGRPAELLLALDSSARGELDHRRALYDAGFTLVTDVELVDGDNSQLVAFATSSGKSLDAFKNAMWAVDEYAGVRYRDPGDPEGHLLDISLNPHPGPLRREMLAQLAAVGRCSVTDLRRFTVTETVYRSADTTRVLTALLTAGLISRTPERGRLGGDVLIELSATASAPSGG